MHTPTPTLNDRRRREEFVYDLADHYISNTTKAGLWALAIDRVSEMLLKKTDEELLNMAPDNLIKVPKKKKTNELKINQKDFNVEKANVVEAKGTIYKESGNGYFNVELDEPEGFQCLCRASGKLITRKFTCLLETSHSRTVSI